MDKVAIKGGVFLVKPGIGGMAEAIGGGEAQTGHERLKVTSIYLGT